MSSDLNLNNISFQSALRSKIVENNFSDIESNFNSLRAEVNASIASTASEVTSARDNFSTLQDNIHIRKVFNDGISTGGVISAQSTPDNTVRVSAGSGIVNGEGVNWLSGTSGTVAAETTAPRKIVAVIDTSNAVTLSLGATGTSTLPTLSSTQKPLAIISQSTASPAVFSSSDILDARNQGCWIPKKREYHFKIQDAINSLGNTLGGDIEIGAGNYYEDLTYKNYQTLKFDAGANLYTANGTATNIDDIDIADKTNTQIKYNNGLMSSEGSISSLYIDTTGTATSKLMKTKTIEMGAWDMDTGGAVISINHNLGSNFINIRSISLSIINDSGAALFTDTRGDTLGGTVDVGVSQITSTTIQISRLAGGFFQTSSFSSAVINRGWVTVTYEV